MIRVSEDKYSLYILPLADVMLINTVRERERLAGLLIAKHIFGEDAIVLHTSDGAPYIKGRPNVLISISHNREYAVMALSLTGTSIGVDIETPRLQLLKITSRYATDTELSFHGCSIDALLRLWTAKEAVYKAARQKDIFLKDIEIRHTEAFVKGTKYKIQYHQPGEIYPAIISVAI